VHKFDRVFGRGVATITVDKNRVGPVIEDLVQGVDACIVGYGQTGAGKTTPLSITLFGEAGERAVGIAGFALSNLVEKLVGKRTLEEETSKEGATGYFMTATMVQLHNDKVFDPFSSDASSAPVQL